MACRRWRTRSRVNAEKVETREIQADNAEIEQDAKAAGAGQSTAAAGAAEAADDADTED